MSTSTVEIINKIETVEQLEELAKAGKCVNWHGRHIPASGVLNMQARIVLRHIKQGLFEHKPKPKKDFPKIHKSQRGE
jgi:hypothetical protein